MSTPETSELLRRARRAQARAAEWTQEQADAAVAAAGWAAYREDDAREVTGMAVAETGMGRADHQLERHRTRVLGTLRDLGDARTVGVVERDARLGLVKVAKPVGVVAARSGTPAYGAGAGNATVVVDETADVEAAARLVAAGKSFDHGTSCSSESCLVIHRSRWRQLLAALGRHGGHLLSGDEGTRLRQALRPSGRALDRAFVGRPPSELAAAAGVEVPPDVRFLMVEGGEPEPHNAFCLEKLCPVLALWSYDDFAQAIDLVNRLTDLGGPGHSCGIHTRSDDHIRALAGACRTGRLLVNQSPGLANSGSFGNGMPFSVVLACGTWGGSVSCENLTWRHWLNYTWVSEPVERRQPAPEDFFAEHWRRYGR